MFSLALRLSPLKNSNVGQRLVFFLGTIESVYRLLLCTSSPSCWFNFSFRYRGPDPGDPGDEGHPVGGGRSGSWPRLHWILWPGNLRRQRQSLCWICDIHRCQWTVGGSTSINFSCLFTPLPFQVVYKLLILLNKHYYTVNVSFDSLISLHDFFGSLTAPICLLHMS